VVLAVAASHRKELRRLMTELQANVDWQLEKIERELIRCLPTLEEIPNHSAQDQRPSDTRV